MFNVVSFCWLVILSGLQAAQESTKLDARDRVKLGVITVLLNQLTISQDLMLTRGTITFPGREGVDFNLPLLINYGKGYGFSVQVILFHELQAKWHSPTTC